MAQHDMNIANQGFPAFRADLNDALGALVSNSSGSTEPSTMFAHQFWVDTSANPSVLKQRNADNDAWITIGSINQTNDTFNLAVAQGGTGAADASGARTNLGLVIGTDVQAYSANLAGYAATGIGFRNRIINGDMRIDQRNNGAAVTINDTSAYTVDRWFGEDVTDGAFTVQRDSSAPAGFNFSARITVTTADSSLAAGQYAVFTQRIEGFNWADLSWGTAAAQTVTLSFWTRSSLTGTFGGVVQNGAENYSYPFTYTISAADTWEYKTITIVGPTAGTWIGATNARAVILTFSLGSGSTFTGPAGAWVAADDRGGATGQTNVMGTLNATWFVTGVQLEVGTVATSFDFRSYGTELALCQRYFEKSFNQSTAPAQNAGASGAFRFVQAISVNLRQICCGTAFFRVTKRATPTVTLFNPEAANSLPRNQQRALDWVDAGSLGKASPSDSVIQFTDWTTASAGGAGDDFTVQWTASAEL
jgi:hypothetical protein